MNPSSLTASPSRAARQRGIAVMLTALMLVGTIPIVGLAIDAGLLYLIRARLSSACDAAALATARNLNLGMNLADQIANATARGTAFFNANFPSGYLGTASVTPTISVEQTAMNTLSVTTSATATANLYFLRVLGTTATLTSSTGRASRRDVNVMLVLDRSASMNVSSACTPMIVASKTFSDLFMQDRDRLGMVTFGGTVFNAYAPTRDFKNPVSSINAAIDQVVCTGQTNTAHAYWNAYQQLVAINQPLALNVIILFTDGVPNTLTARFPIRTIPDVRRDNPSSWICGGATSYVECLIPRSPCQDDNGFLSGHASWGTFAPKLGVLTGGNLAVVAGDTFGLLNPTATGPSGGEPMIGTASRVGCGMTGHQRRVREDIAFIPAQDANGISTSGYLDSGVERFPTGHPYAGQVRPDNPTTLSRVAMNLSDNVAAMARNNPTLPVVTYTIGLGTLVDHDILRRMANDPTSPSYDSSRVSGLYVYAPTVDQINAAYARIASEVLRLAL